MAENKLYKHKYLNLQKEKGIRDLSGMAGLGTIKFFMYLVMLLMLLLMGKIVWEGLPVISWNFLIDFPRNNMTEGGIGPAIFGTLSVTLLMILMAVPIGVFSGVYINEYARESLLKRIILLSVNNLAGVPSIVIGLFGLGFFILFLGRTADSILNAGLLFGQPIMLWASATLAILVLPTIIVTTIEALKSVPASQRMAAYGLGATRWETIRKVALPQAAPGILTGIILAVARGAGETAPVLFLGCAFFLPDLPVAYLDFGLFSLPMINPTEQFMYLTYHIFIMATQSANPTLTKPIQYGTTLVLLLIIVLLNFAAVMFRYRFRRIIRDVRGY